VNRDNAIWLVLGLGGGALLLIVGLPLIFLLVTGSGMMSGMMAPMFFFAVPLALGVCLLLPVIVVGIIIYGISRNHKPATR
jgi:hypothetical protein